MKRKTNTEAQKLLLCCLKNKDLKSFCVELIFTWSGTGQDKSVTFFYTRQQLIQKMSASIYLTLCALLFNDNDAYDISTKYHLCAEKVKEYLLTCVWFR